MNRSLYRAMLAASLVSWDEDEWTGGVVDAVAVFPLNRFDRADGHSGGGNDLTFRLPDGSRPFGRWRWWRPDDWNDPLGPGVATIALDMDEGPEVWRVPITVSEFPCASGRVIRSQSSPSLADLLDKPHRARARSGTVSYEPEEWREVTRDFELLEHAIGFVPVMDEWIWNPWLYGSRWYLPLEWWPYGANETDARGRRCWVQRYPAASDSGLRDAVRLLDELRREHGARIRIYPERRHGRRRERTCPADMGRDMRGFVAAYRQRERGAPPDA